MSTDSPTQTATPALRQWILEQARAGFHPEVVLKSMMDSGWHEDVAIASLEETLTTFLAEQTAGTQPEQAPPVAAAVASAEVVEPAAPAQPACRVPEPAVADGSNVLRVDGRDIQVLATLRNPRVVSLGNVLSHDECDQLIELARARLMRSETVDNATGGSEVNAARTSDGMFFSRGETPLIAAIEARLAALVGWPVENGEGLQVLRYLPGAEYKPHYDYFDPAQPGASSILKRGGQRVGTLVLYLNTPTRGGATTFPDIALEVAPSKGNAVFFSYDRPDPATRTLHGGAPVLAGEKWVATKWMREGRFE